MPGDDVLDEMYGSDESRNLERPTEICCGDTSRVVRWLTRLERGRFVDYGCGSGLLLLEARRLGWEAIGVEWDTETAKKASDSTGLPIIGRRELSASLGSATVDVLHLGDVIEHLTFVERQMAEIVGLLKPDGLLLAQGPLQANFTLFQLVLRTSRSITRNLWRTEIAPQHVLLTSAAGQRAFFRRFGLHEVGFDVWETNWPAPSHLRAQDLLRPRPVALYVLAMASRAVSKLRPGRWGNRYFFSGRTQRWGDNYS
jgi:SAM-dependent methyltransferase